MLTTPSSTSLSLLQILLPFESLNYHYFLWTNLNKLLLNPSKTEFGTKQHLKFSDLTNLCLDNLSILVSSSGCPGSNPEWGPIYYKASITAQGLPEPSSLRVSTLGTKAAEHKGCNWGMKVDSWLQPCAVFGYSFSGIGWHMHRNKVNSIALLYRYGLAMREYQLHYIYWIFDES